MLNSILDVEAQTVVKVVGDVDTLGLKRISRSLNAALKRTSSAVVVSFERATSFESGLLKELMRVGEALEVAKRRLLIVIPRLHPGRRIFHLLNLDKRFECFETEAQAATAGPHVEASCGSDLDRVKSWAHP
jgi:anti-anti-sigma regulatory factor